VYVLAALGISRLMFVRRKMPSVPMWQVIIPVAAIVVLGYTLYRNVYPYPSGDRYWFPVVGGAWLAAAVLAAPGTAQARSGAGGPRGHRRDWGRQRDRGFVTRPRPPGALPVGISR